MNLVLLSCLHSCLFLHKLVLPTNIYKHRQSLGCKEINDIENIQSSLYLQYLHNITMLTRAYTIVSVHTFNMSTRCVPTFPMFRLCLPIGNEVGGIVCYNNGMISDNWRTFRSCTEKSFLNLRN